MPVKYYFNLLEQSSQIVHFWASKTEGEGYKFRVVQLKVVSVDW
jgi:hypothetical protein